MPATIVTATRVQLLFLSRETLLHLVSKHTLKRFKRLFEQRKQWREDRFAAVLKQLAEHAVRPLAVSRRQQSDLLPAGSSSYT